MSAVRPLLLGHRGARCHAPENTLQAFETALAHGCDGFEFDVRLTADHYPVICHDPRLAHQMVARARRAALDAPTLDAVLAQFASRAFLDIELKVGGLERLTAELVKRHPPQRGYFVSSFLPTVIQSLYAMDGSVRLGLICNNSRQLLRWKSLPVEAVFVERSLATEPLIAQLHAAGKQVFVWTVNRPAEIKKFAAMEVEGIISDDTELLAKTLRH